MPGNAVLPVHNGMVITRNLQETACLLPLALPFATVQRLLAWETQCAEMICTTEVHCLVRTHGHAEKANDLIGDERDRILWYTGCAQLVK